jgi:hypothetical protein
MRLITCAVAAVGLLLVSGGLVRADEQEAKAIVDKAIKAIGGEEKLGKIEAFTYKSKGTVNFGGNENDFEGTATIKGFGQLRREFGTDQFHGVVVVNGDKGWRRFGDETNDLEGDALSNEKRGIYLQVIPITLVALKTKDYKCETAGEEKVGDKPAVVLKITGPDGKDFTLSFDKESGLPVKQVAKVLSFQGEERTQETTYADYKEMGGIKKATKVEVKRDGEPFQNTEITEFKVMDKVDPDSFSEPK